MSHFLITGGSRGIGAATARLAVDRGHRVTFTYRVDDAAASAVTGELGGRAIAVRADAADVDAVDVIFRAAVAAHGPVDVLVNNAAMNGRLGAFVDGDTTQDRAVLETDVLAVLAYSRHAARLWLAEGRSGVVVNLSSVAATTGAPHEYVTYAAAKAAVDSFTRGLGRELGPHGIRVVAISPGTTDTDIHATAGDPARAARVGARVPLGRPAQPAEIAEAILWAASDQASYLTATTVSVSGGM